MKPALLTVLIVVCVLLFACMLYSLAVLAVVGDKITGSLFPTRDPIYPGIRLSINDGGRNVYCLNAGLEGDLPGDVFIKVEDDAVSLPDISEAQLRQLGFEPFGRSKIFAIGMGSPSYSRASLSKSGRLLEIQIQNHDVYISSSKDGPFITIPCTFQEYKACFGEPIAWKSR